MAPSSFRLDTLAANLIERLEPVRRAHLDAPETARAAMERTTRELAGNVANECRNVLGDEAQAHRIEAEAVETFLPRYARIALEQNKVERREAITPSNLLVQRLVPLVFGIFASRFLAIAAPGPWDIAFFFVPLLALFWPEWLGALARRRYLAELQEIADDLGRLQDADEKLTPAPSEESLTAEVDALESIRRKHQQLASHEKG